MEHEEALRNLSAEKYLLKEMPEEQRSDFEAHYFDCQECAAEVRATAAFLAVAKQELRPSGIKRKTPKKPFWFEFLGRPAMAAPAFALLLLLAIYQNAVVIPDLHHDNAKLNAPQLLTSLSLIGGNSRGSGVPSLVVAKGQPLLLWLDIPTIAQYSSYTCVLLSPTGAEWRLPVSSDQARDTVAIHVPAAALRRGDYRLIVQGQTHAGERPVDLANYQFTLSGFN
jgi:hypothetical protein